MRRAAGCALAAVLALAGCTSGPTPSPTASPPSATPIGSPSDSAGVLRFAIAAEPSGFLPPALDAGTARIQHFLYDALYRLDDHLRAQPDLAAGAPSVSSDGRTWVIDLRTSATFSDGSHLSAADVVTTYGLALSPACPFAADQCRLARIHLDAVTAEGSGMVVFSLSAPFAPLQAELLAALPILPAKALGDSLDRLLADAGGTDPVTLSAAVDRITSATSAEGCLAPSPPVGCDLADHIDEMTGLAVAAHLAALDPRRYVDDTGAPDRSSFGAALLARLRDLAAVLTMKKLDRLAAALPLLDLDRAPIGTGAYRLTRYEPGAFVELERRTRPKAGQPARIRAIVLPDPTAAATALLSGQLDWLPDVAPELAPVLAGDPTVHVAARPSGSVRALVFNVRAGHPFAAEVARQALVRCLDRPALVARATQGGGLAAASLVAPASWAYAPARAPAPDPAAARAMLEAAGYILGADGVYERAGQRLAGEVLVRPGRADLAALASAMSVDLRGCGIELRVREVAFSSELILAQLEWPNTFDISLATIRTGPDPDVDLGWLGSAHVTTQLDPGDANFGGWNDAVTDSLLAEGDGRLSGLARAAAYRSLQAHLAAGSPVVPLVLDVAYAAVSSRLRLVDGAVDPSLMTYESGVDDWTLAAP